jgi:hypothetical protein
MFDNNRIPVELQSILRAYIGSHSDGIGCTATLGIGGCDCSRHYRDNIGIDPNTYHFR